MTVESSFSPQFRALTGNEPMPWQEAVFGSFCAGDFSRPLSLPTGLGKTSVVHLWLLALSAAPERVPRRLVYVVNRRTVVDQATREAEKVREVLATPDAGSADPKVIATRRQLRDSLLSLCAKPVDVPLAISTLRGQFADNGEWVVDPCRPAIILGTVDMIGSRLLFSAYGRGFRTQPRHAGLLGQDVLLVHDEAHLEPAFQHLIDGIRAIQVRRSCRAFYVMELTATPRSEREPFQLTQEDLLNDTVRKRINAEKRIRLHSIDDEKVLARKLVELALLHAQSEAAVLVFVRSPEDAKRIAGLLPGDATRLLTGTQRGFERDSLVESPVFQRFVPESARSQKTSPAPGTVYLVCTSAGEVGVDISADHLVCDLTTFESMAQRFGRVNRYGGGSAQIDVVHPTKYKTEESEYEASRERTLHLLQSLEGDGSPKALSELPSQQRLNAFAPAPETLELNEILMDSWAMTSIRGKLPGRPPVADWLHGIQAWEPPLTDVAWRHDVTLTEQLTTTHSLRELLDAYPLKPHELLHDRSDRVRAELRKLAASFPSAPAWILVPNEEVIVRTLAELAEEEDDFLNDRTVVLSPTVGGLRNGVLDASSPEANDVSDAWFVDELREKKRRERWSSVDPTPKPPPEMRLVLSLDLRPSDEEELAHSPSDTEEAVDLEDSNHSVPHRYWHWYVLPRSADDDGSQFARTAMPLSDHLESARYWAAKIADGLHLPAEQAESLILAAAAHDLGKKRLVWQRSIGNRDYASDPSAALAKSAGRMRPMELGCYRHELGSLLDLRRPEHSPAFLALSEHSRDLVQHLIAAHHGRARPCFPEDETFDPEHPDVDVGAVVAATADRFVRLQRHYGYWGLAYLESLLRAADALASGAQQ